MISQQHDLFFLFGNYFVTTMILVAMIPLLWIGFSVSFKLHLLVYIFVSFPDEQKEQKPTSLGVLLQYWAYFWARNAYRRDKGEKRTGRLIQGGGGLANGKAAPLRASTNHRPVSSVLGTPRHCAIFWTFERKTFRTFTVVACDDSICGVEYGEY